MTESFPAEDPWLAAERAADLNRYARQNPTHQQLFAERWLGPLTVLLAAADFIAGAVVLFGSSPVSNPLHPVADLGAFLVLLLGFCWSFLTGRTVLSGTPSIQAALPRGAWPLLRRQITGKEPLDSTRAEITIELAHQLRQRQQGQFVFLLWYPPLYLSLSASDTTAAPALLNIAVILFLIIAAASGLNYYRRVARFLHSHPLNARPE